MPPFATPRRHDGRYKMAMLVALVVGILSGAITMAFVLSMPIDEPLFSFFGAKSDNHIVAGLLLWLSENSRLITAAFLSVLITLGMISIVNNIQEIKAMRYSLGNNSSSMLSRVMTL